MDSILNFKGDYHKNIENKDAKQDKILIVVDNVYYLKLLRAYLMKEFKLMALQVPVLFGETTMVDRMRFKASLN